MPDKNDILKIKKELKNKKCVALLAPSFVSEFKYPDIVFLLKKIGFDKVIELTFGAKMVNSEYHKILRENKLHISTVCPGITEFIKTNYPQLKNNLIPVDSPMIATAKICKKNFPKHKTIFISPCNFKKQEAQTSKFIDFVIDYQQLKELTKNVKIKPEEKPKIEIFDGLYNDYTKIYPLTGGLSKTAHLKGILKKDETKIIDGVQNVKKYLDSYIKNPTRAGVSPDGQNKKIKFLDINFCVGGCIGGPCLTKDKTLSQKKKLLVKYLNYSKKATIPEKNRGWIKKAEGIKFRRDY